MKNIIIKICIASLTLSFAGCMAAPRSLPPGEYSKTQTSTNSQGTDMKKTTDTDVYYDQYGNKRAKQTVKTINDPKGLFNKSTTKSTSTY